MIRPVESLYVILCDGKPLHFKVIGAHPVTMLQFGQCNGKSLPLGSINACPVTILQTLNKILYAERYIRS